jgi:HlyD family secretion protein
MTANLVITIDERNGVLKVPNAALRFTPQDAATRREARQGGQRQDRQSNSGGDAAQAGDRQQGSGERRFAPANAPVVEGQTRRVWVMSADGKLQPRRIKVGLSDGASTEVLEGDLQEGELVVTGQTESAATRTQQTRQQTSAPGFGGAPRGSRR